MHFTQIRRFDTPHSNKNNILYFRNSKYRRHTFKYQEMADVVYIHFKYDTYRMLRPCASKQHNTWFPGI